MGVQHWSKQHAPHLFDGGTGGGHAIAELLEHHDWPAFVLAFDLCLFARHPVLFSGGLGWSLISVWSLLHGQVLSTGWRVAP